MPQKPYKITTKGWEKSIQGDKDFEATIERIRKKEEQWIERHQLNHTYLKEQKTIYNKDLRQPLKFDETDSEILKHWDKVCKELWNAHFIFKNGSNRIKEALLSTKYESIRKRGNPNLYQLPRTFIALCYDSFHYLSIVKKIPIRFLSQCLQFEDDPHTITQLALTKAFKAERKLRE
jgi:hypothetical protein